MRGFRGQSAATKWARFALKCGLLLTDTKLWASISERLQHRADELGEQVKRKYDDTVGRLEDARSPLVDRNQWIAPTVNFLGGIGIGVGLGILFAPVSGEEARAAVRHKVVDIKNKVTDIASAAANVRTRQSTGTGGARQRTAQNEWLPARVP